MSERVTPPSLVGKSKIGPRLDTRTLAAAERTTLEAGGIKRNASRMGLSKSTLYKWTGRKADQLPTDDFQTERRSPGQQIAMSVVTALEAGAPPEDAFAVLAEILRQFGLEAHTVESLEVVRESAVKEFADLIAQTGPEEIAVYREQMAKQRALPDS